MNQDIKLQQQQKLIYQLNDLVSLIIEELDVMHPNFKEKITNKFKVSVKKIYSIDGKIQKTKYNLN